MKTYKKNILKTIVLIFLFQGLITATQDLDDRTKNISVQKGGHLVMNVDPGSVEISTWNEDKIQIITRGLDEREVEDLNIKKSGNEVTVSYESYYGWSQSVDFIISAPKEFNFEVSTSSGEIRINNDVIGNVNLVSMSGEIKINDVTGNVDIKTYGGEIKSGDINGEVNLNTQGGSIRVGNIKKGPVDIETMGGEIRIRNVESGLKVKTMGGEIEIGDIGGDADVITYGGDIKVDNVAGDATLDTYGGDIRLRSASGVVYASTYGGDLTLYNITGSVDAKTASGNIYCELNPSGKGRTRLETAMGDIELVLPKEAKASIEAEITIKGSYRGRRDDYQIKSDFEPTRYETDRNRREIFATFELNGGGEKIYIKTNNSDIEIRKVR